MAREIGEQKAAFDGGGTPYKQHVPWWMTFANGRVYRPLMRVAHRYGFCFPQAAPVEPGCVWCHWCGMRGRR